MCAWCQAIEHPVKRSLFFDELSSHGSCPACAIKLLSNRPKALMRYLVKHMDELEKLPPPKGFIIVGSTRTSIASYRQLLAILKQK